MPRSDKLILKLAKGYRGRAKNCLKIARMRVEKGLLHAYRGRKEKKRDMRSLWIMRVNASVRYHGINYSRFIWGLNQCQIGLNRKMLSEMAIHEPLSFKSIVEYVRQTAGVKRQTAFNDAGWVQSSNVWTTVSNKSDAAHAMDERTIPI